MPRYLKVALEVPSVVLCSLCYGKTIRISIFCMTSLPRRVQIQTRRLHFVPVASDLDPKLCLLQYAARSTGRVEGVYERVRSRRGFTSA